MVDVTISENVATITMDDGKANVFHFESIDALNEALDEAEAKAGAIVLAGRTGMFSGGFDLSRMASATEEDIARLLTISSDWLLRLLENDRPVFAACTGHAVAMGLFTMLACDVRIGASGSFKVTANETVINMRLPTFGAALVRTRIIPTECVNSIVFSKVFDPEAALQAGFFDQIVDADAVVATAQAMASKAASLPRDAFGYNKRLLQRPLIEEIRAHKTID